MRLKHFKSKGEANRELRANGYRNRYSNVWMKFNAKRGLWGTAYRVLVKSNLGRGVNEWEILK